MECIGKYGYVYEDRKAGKGGLEDLENDSGELEKKDE